MVALRWDARTGLTSLIRFGETMQSVQLPEVRALPVALSPNDGYDGQYYAQVAVALDMQRPELAAALGNPAYRAQRILLPCVAHAIGWGDPWRILQVYALLNAVAWLAYAWVWWRESPPSDGPGLARWAGALLALGALDSVRLSLTDLPCLLFLVLGLRAARAARAPAATAWLALAALTRETAVLGLLAIEVKPTPQRSARRALAFSWALRAAALLPVVLWIAWLRTRFPQAPSVLGEAFTWPGFGLARQVATCVRELAAGNLDSRFTFGLAAALGFAWQSVFLLTRWRSTDPWVRMALPFAVLFWFCGDQVWHGYWAVARACLPMTVAFVRLAPLRAPWFLANLAIVHGVYRLLPGG